MQSIIKLDECKITDCDIRVIINKEWEHLILLNMGSIYIIQKITILMKVLTKYGKNNGKAYKGYAQVINQ